MEDTSNAPTVIASSVGRSSKHDPSNILFGQIMFLRDSIRKQAQKNMELYNQLKQQDIYVDFQIYQPQVAPARQGRNSCHLGADKGQLINVLDRLMHESTRLNKIQQKAKFIAQQEAAIVASDFDTAADSYSFMRKAWNLNRPADETVEDRIDRLAKIIGSLKGNVLKTISKEASRKSTTDPMEDLYVCREYERIKQKYEEACMRKVEVECRLSETIHQYEQMLKKRDEKIEGLMGKLDSQQKDILEKQKKIEQLSNLIEKLKIESKCHTKSSSKASSSIEPDTQKVQTYLGCGFKIQLVELTSHTETLQNNSTFEMRRVARSLEDLIIFLESDSPKTLAEQTSNRRPERSIVRDVISPYKQQISNMKFSRAAGAETLRKLNQNKAALPANFYTKIQILEKFDNHYAGVINKQ